MKSLEERKAERNRRTLEGPEGVVIEKDDPQAKPPAVNPNQEPERDRVYNRLPGASQIPDPEKSRVNTVTGDDTIESSQSLVQTAEQAQQTDSAATGNGSGAATWGAPAAPAKTTKAAKA